MLSRDVLGDARGGGKAKEKGRKGYTRKKNGRR